MTMNREYLSQVLNGCHFSLHQWRGTAFVQVYKKMYNLFGNSCFSREYNGGEQLLSRRSNQMYNLFGNSCYLREYNGREQSSCVGVQNRCKTCFGTVVGSENIMEGNRSCLGVQNCYCLRESHISNNYYKPHPVINGLNLIS